jgi:hypothetical protein
MWKPAATVFPGGSQQVTALRGRRVRNRVPLLRAAIHDPIHHHQTTIDVRAYSIGFVASPVNDQVLIAYSKSDAPMTTIENLMRTGAFDVIRVNWVTFRLQFDIDV